MKRWMVSILTGSRVPGGILAAWLISQEHWLLAIVLLLVGFITDLTDGPLARKWGVDSEFGWWFDAQADRVLLVSPLFGMAAAGDVPLALSAVLAVGIYMADTTAEQLDFGLMRVVWWPLCYAAIAYGLVMHTPVVVVGISAVVFAVGAAFLAVTKPEQVRNMKTALGL